MWLVLRPGSASRGREVYTGGEHVFTTPPYFDPALTERVHRSGEPDVRRNARSASAGSIQSEEVGNGGLCAKATFEDGVVIAQTDLARPARARRLRVGGRRDGLGARGFSKPLERERERQPRAPRHESLLHVGAFAFGQNLRG